NAYNADLLHFDFVLCAAIAIAFPIRGARRRALAVVSTLAALFAFHTVALLVTVENTYANVLAEVARRNYSPAEASIYTWLYRLFAHIGIQLLPAAVLGVLYVGQGGIGGGPGQPRQLALPVAPPTLSRWATRAIAIVVAAIALTLAGAGL